MEGAEVEAVAAQIVLRTVCTWRRGAVEQLVALLSGILIVCRQVAVVQQAGIDVEQVVRLCIGDVDEAVDMVELLDVERDLIANHARDAVRWQVVEAARGENLEEFIGTAGLCTGFEGVAHREMTGEAIDLLDGGEFGLDLLDEGAHGTDGLSLEEQHEDAAARMDTNCGGGQVLPDDRADAEQYCALDCGSLIAVLIFIGTGLNRALNCYHRALVEIACDKISRLTPCNDIDKIGLSLLACLDKRTVNGNAKRCNRYAVRRGAKLGVCHQSAHYNCTV